MFINAFNMNGDPNGNNCFTQRVQWRVRLGNEIILARAR